MAKKQKLKTVPCEFRTVSIGAESVSMGILWSRSDFDLIESDAMFTCAQVAITFESTKNGGDPDEPGLIADDDATLRFDGIPSCQGINCKRDTISATLKFPRTDIELDDLIAFAQRAGKFTAERTGDAAGADPEE